MRESQYFSQRSGRNPFSGEITFSLLFDLFLSTYSNFMDCDYFQENIGSYSKNDFRDYYPGKLGEDSDIERKLFLKLRKKDMWPIKANMIRYSEEDLFDIIEFCYDYISKPIYREEHDGVPFPRTVLDHYDSSIAQREYRDALNQHLKDYDSGYEIDSKGCIVSTAEYGLEPIFQAKLPTNDKKNIAQPVEYAVNKFRNRNASVVDKRESVRSLANVLEYLRPKAKKVITKKDEDDLFNLINQFGLRHHNQRQKTDYDEKIWLNWMFYYFLATIHSILRLLKTQKEGSIAED